MTRRPRVPLPVPIITRAITQALGMALIAVVNGGAQNNSLGWVHLLGAFLAFFGGHLTAIRIGIFLLRRRRNRLMRRSSLTGVLSVVIGMYSIVVWELLFGAVLLSRLPIAPVEDCHHSPRLTADPHGSSPFRKGGHMPTTNSETTTIRELAESHGLDIDPKTIIVNELGLDFQVAIAKAVDGQSWVLRIPRRPDVTDRATVEGRFLRNIAPHLSVAVPDWQIHTEYLIAYPLLPGEPGLTIDEQGQPQWHFDVEAAEYAESLGDFLAELHSVDPSIVRSSGIAEYSPAEVKAHKRDDIARVVAEFDVEQSLRERWNAWLDDDSYWPKFTTVTHGEVYPAHQLMDGPKNLSILDWTTAAVGDPARDFMFHHASVSAEAFDATIRRYVENGGQVWPKFAAHCGELFSTSPVELGLYALQTGDADHIEAAKAQLNPSK